MGKRGLVIAVAVAMILGCSSGSTTTGTPGPGGSNPCIPPGHGNSSHAAPIVCIDFTNFTNPGYAPDPNPVTAKRGAHIEFWFFNFDAANPPEMDVLLPPDLPVQHIKCKDEMCSAEVKPNAPAASGKYTVVDRISGRYEDPDIIIEPIN